MKTTKALECEITTETS